MGFFLNEFDRNTDSIKAYFRIHALHSTIRIITYNIILSHYMIKTLVYRAAIIIFFYADKNQGVAKISE